MTTFGSFFPPGEATGSGKPSHCGTVPAWGRGDAVSVAAPLNLLLGSFSVSVLWEKREGFSLVPRF